MTVDLCLSNPAQASVLVGVMRRLARKHGLGYFEDSIDAGRGRDTVGVEVVKHQKAYPALNIRLVGTDGTELAASNIGRFPRAVALFVIVGTDPSRAEALGRDLVQSISPALGTVRVLKGGEGAFVTQWCN